MFIILSITSYFAMKLYKTGMTNELAIIGLPDNHTKLDLDFFTERGEDGTLNPPSSPLPRGNVWLPG